MLNLPSKYLQMGNYSRHVLQTNNNQNFILESASAPFVVDAQHCEFSAMDTGRSKQFTVKFDGHAVQGTVGHLNPSLQDKLMQKMKFQPPEGGLKVVCVPDLKKGAPDAKGNKILGLDQADGIIGLAMAGGKKNCDTCYSNAEVNLIHQTNMHGFRFNNRDEGSEKRKKPAPVFQQNLCGLHGTPQHTVAPLDASLQTFDNIHQNISVSAVFPSHCSNQSNKIFDLGWPREQEGIQAFDCYYGVDLVDEGNIESLEVDYKKNKISYQLRHPTQFDPDKCSK